MYVVLTADFVPLGLRGRGKRGSLCTRERVVGGRTGYIVARCGWSLRVLPFLMVLVSTTVHPGWGVWVSEGNRRESGGQRRAVPT